MPPIRIRPDGSNRLREPVRSSPSRNELIASLTETDRQLVAPSMELVHLHAATVLCHQGDPVRHVYFPIRGLVSLLGTTADGDVLQVAAVGRLGIVGVPVILEEDESPYQVVAHASCDAYRMRAQVLRAVCHHSSAVRHMLLRAAHAQLVMIGDVALCHRFHTALQRLSRCLLAYTASTSSDTVALTQDVLANILGSPRTVVSRAASQLQDLNAIRQRHGRLQIVDRLRMAEYACACGMPGKHTAT